MINQNSFSYFHQSVVRFPDRPALYVDDSEYSYQQLDRKVNGIARRIQKYETESGRFIGLFARQSLTAYAGILAILKSGKAYVPLNPKYPVKRNETISRKTELSVLIADQDNLQHLAAYLAAAGSRLTVILPEADASVADQIDTSGKHRLIFRDELEHETETTDAGIRPAGRYAYLLFTSGSTGTPKGVPVSHANLCSYIDQVNTVNNFSENDRFSQTFELTFDPSVQDMFSAWSNGAALYPLPDRYRFLPAKFIRRHQLTVWHSVPSIPRIMNLYGTLKPGMFPHLRYSMFGGEPLHLDVAKLWRQAAPGSLIDNLYGPTEITITISQYRWDPMGDLPVKSRHGIVSIGKIYPKHRHLILAEEKNGDTARRQGELLISGAQVVDSYFGNEEETQKSFVRRGEAPDTIWYRTGDIVQADDEGDLYYIGRKDDQVKVRGNRVEPGEIEYTLQSFTGPQTANILPYPHQGGNTEYLVLFLLESVQHHNEEIFGFCKRKLPDYMVPQKIVRVKQFPLNENGKIDRNKLITLYEDEKKKRNI